MTPEMLTTSEAARRAGLNVRYITSLIRAGKIKGDRFGRAWMVDAQSLQAFANSQRNPGPKGPIGPRKKDLAHA